VLSGPLCLIPPVVYWKQLQCYYRVAVTSFQDFVSVNWNALASTWPHMRCDVGLDEEEYRENCLCVAVLCTVIMVHKGTSSSYRLVDCIGL